MKTRQTGQAAAPSALAGFEALLGLVDDVNATLAAYQAIVAVAGAQRAERIADFHGRSLVGRLVSRIKNGRESAAKGHSGSRGN